jgi:prolyl-tRNA synthetase
MFADMELIGIPHRIVIGERSLDKGVVEYKARRETEAQEVPVDQVIELLKNKLLS